jgi:hypothetical protein
MTNIIGWHLGNAYEPTETDWRILEALPPRCVVFLPDEGVAPDHLRRILGLAPDCAIIMRPYYTPQEPAPAALSEYLDRCRRAMDRYWPVVPEAQRHLQVFNEQNMPRWANWEGFGDQLAGMQLFDDWFCCGYSQIKHHDPHTLVGWTPLTPGNRDMWFPGDALGHYYLHGPAGCEEALSEAQRREAIATSPCKASLQLADEFYAHVYIHEGRDAYREPWRGLRFERYRRFLPKPMRVWITEAGYPRRDLWPAWGDDALLDWMDALVGRDVAGVALWILGDKEQWGAPWYDGDEPRLAVHQLADWQRMHGEMLPEEIVPDVILPETEETVSERLSADVAATALRWHCEEATREVERGEHAAALARLKALVDRERGLAYRVEDTVHAMVETLRGV